MHRSLTRAASSVPWPNVRLWVQPAPNGTAAVSERRQPDALVAFDAYSSKLPGTREVALGGSRFFAFVSPRLGTEHFVVWRRTEDVRNTGQKLLNSSPSDDNFCISSPVRITSASEREPLTAAVWCWDRPGVQDERRYWDDGAGGTWMYWESFWAPCESAASASTAPAFGDASGAMLAPMLSPNAESHLSEQQTVDQEQWGADCESAVSSTSTATSMKDRAYAIVYQCNVWGSDVSRSGTGSDLWSPEARLAVTALEATIHHFGIRSMLDCACGDATWIVPFFVSRYPEIAYCGIDIVSEVIEQNKARHPGIHFLAIDLAESPLPTGADLVFSKETLNHMDLLDAHAALRRFAETGARYLLTNVHKGANNSLGRGKKCFTTYIKYDYSLPPFNMKRFASVIEYQGPQTSYCVFDLQSVQ